MIHGDACFAYFNKIWGIPRNAGLKSRTSFSDISSILH